MAEGSRTGEAGRLVVAQQQLAAPGVGRRVGYDQADQPPGHALRLMLLHRLTAAERDRRAELAGEAQARLDWRGVRPELAAERPVALFQAQRLDRVVAGQLGCGLLAGLGQPLE